MTYRGAKGVDEDVCVSREAGGERCCGLGEEKMLDFKRSCSS
jgi:hypothetical protein